MQDYGNSNIHVFLKPLFRGNLDPFVNNANLGATAHTSNGTSIFIVYRKKCCNLHNAFMVRRLGLGKNNHLTYASLVLNPRSRLLDNKSTTSIIPYHSNYLFMHQSYY